VLRRNATAKAQAVYIGYGIHAPELGHDDLADIDIDGKIVLMVTGAPGHFNSEVRAHHGSGSTKYSHLARRGAVSVVTVLSSREEKKRPFAKRGKSSGGKRYGWIRLKPSQKRSGSGAAATISYAIATDLFADIGKAFKDELAATEAGKKGGFELGVVIAMETSSKHSKIFRSPNVVAGIEGSDPILKNEYVVISAHLDHIGMGKARAKGKDRINNGALDNAIGVAVMLDVARVYASADVKPRRSIIFAAVTGEEPGLLGSQYFAKYPTVKKSSIVANVNVDMPILLYDFTDIIAFGADRSSLGPITREAVSQIGVTLSPDPMPEQGVFTRSDHYRFVQEGVPSVFLVTGWGEGTHGKDGGKIFREFWANTYHSPRDDIHQEIDYQAGAKFAYINWLIISAIANVTERPTWNQGDFFGDTFAGK